MTDPLPHPAPRHRMGYRSHRRRQQHEEASSQSFTASKVVEHPLIPSDAPRWVTTQREFEDLIGHVRAQGVLCYDSEFIGESFYRPRLCLVQIGTARQVAVVDALAGLDLAALWELLADATVLKVVHAGQQDLEPVVRHLGRPPAHVFDTQIAAGFVGLPYPLSLSRMTHELLGVRMNKGLTFTSWDHRPLSPAHLHYAADDVRYGLALHEQIGRRLGELGHDNWAAQACAKLCDPSLYTLDYATVAQKMRGAKSLSGPQGAVRAELVGLRDEIARLHDLPPRTILKDELMMDMARKPPKTAEHLEQIRGLPRPIKVDFGRKILDVVRQGLEKNRPPWPPIHEREETPSQQFRMDLLWSAFQAYCRCRSVDPVLVANRADLAEAWAQRTDAKATSWKHPIAADFMAAVDRGEMTVNLGVGASEDP